MNYLSVGTEEMSRKHRDNKGHRRAASIGTTLDKMLRPHHSLEKSNSANSSFDKGFDREKGASALAESKLKGDVVKALALESGKRRDVIIPQILPPRPASLSPTLGLVPPG